MKIQLVPKGWWRWALVAGVGLTVGFLFGLQRAELAIMYREQLRWPFASMVFATVFAVISTLALSALWSALAPTGRRVRPDVRKILLWTSVALTSGVAMFFFSGKAPYDEILLYTCASSTQPGITGSTIGDSTSCTLPRGVIVTRVELTSQFQGNGTVSIDGRRVLELKNSSGFPPDRRLLAAALSPDRSFSIKTEVRSDLAALTPLRALVLVSVFGFRK